MTVVTDAGPLMALGKLGCLDLLQPLFGQVCVPEAVYAEVVEQGLERSAPDAYATLAAVQHSTLLVVRLSDVRMSSKIDNLPLGLGEKQALHLVQRDSAELLLCDDARAREAARALGIACKGTLGVLAQAYRSGHLTETEAKFYLSAIRARNDIWIAGELCDQVAAVLFK